MSTLTMPMRPYEQAASGSVPWRRVAWVIWRQHRIAMAGMVLFLGAIAAYVWRAGLTLHHAYAAATRCNLHAAGCADLIAKFNGDMNHPLVGGFILQPIPALLGAFIAAPLLARELETGTFRYAWTQGFGRWRWTLAKLVALAVAVTAAAAAISVLFSWYYQPYLASANESRQLSELSPFGLALFDLRGVAFAAWTLAAFSIGALAGMLIRRVVPAIVATLAAYAGLALIAANLLRQHYLAPVLSRASSVPGSAWIYSQWWTKNGGFAFRTWNDAPLQLQQACGSSPVGPLHKPLTGTLAQCFAQHGYVHVTRYQPAGRFWAFQSIEAGWLLALSALLIGITVWLVQRRLT